MRRIALVLATLLLAAGCTSVPWVNNQTGETFHWKRTEAEVHLYVVVDPSANSIKSLVGTAMTRWQPAKYIALHWAPGNVCATGQSCIIVKGAAVNGGSGGFSFTTGSHIVRGFMTVDNRTPIDSQRMNAVCHEMGHTLGLAHGDEPGPCQGGWPTGDDMWVVNHIHEHRHTT